MKSFLEKNPLIGKVGYTGTEQNGFERKTEITEFAILDGIWTKNGQMAKYSPEKLSIFSHSWARNVLTVDLKERMPAIIGIMRME